ARSGGDGGRPIRWRCSGEDEVPGTPRRVQHAAAAGDRTRGGAPKDLTIPAGLRLGGNLTHRSGSARSSHMTDSVARMPEPGHQPQSLHSRSSPDRLAAAHERAGLLLSDRYAEQSISERDFESLLARLRDATDIASVDAVVEELHLIPRESADLPDVQREQRRPSLPSDERRLLAVMSETKRKGRWEVPRLLRVRALMAEVKLDFRETEIPHGLTIDVHALMSQVTVIVPRDVI